MFALGFALAVLIASWAAILIAFAAPLSARWREPVFRQPILILESDDWGAGPPEQAQALDRIAALLERVRDASGRPAVMTLGIVFEVPDGHRIAAEGFATYYGTSLSDARFAGVRAALLRGVDQGVFAPQLHGQYHYWPPALMAVSATDKAVRAWLTVPGNADTESLPSHLQSSWVDASCLPSREIPADAITAAVVSATASFHRTFARPADVAVPTTFVWNDATEAAWARAGVKVVITPGRRATCRDEAGLPGCVDRHMLNGQHSAAGQTYLVRDIYFEPARGHPPEQLAAGLAEQAALGRPALAEIHRSNFLGASADASLRALAEALEIALQRFPNLRFLSSAELAAICRSKDHDWLDKRLSARARAWATRLKELPRFSALARISGLVWMVRLLEAWA